jgi:hypothetical protein
MKRLAFAGLFLVPSSLLACASESYSDVPQGSVLDAAQAAQFVASTQSDVHDTLLRLLIISSLAWSPDSPIDPSADTATIAAGITGNLQSITKSCAYAKVESEPDTNVVLINIDQGCPLGGFTAILLGKASITVSKDASGVSLTYACNNLVLDRRSVNGIFSIATSDGKTYRVDASITEQTLGPIAFRGTARWAKSGGVLGVTLDGTGQYHGEDDPAAGLFTNGWTCHLAATSDFTTKGLHQSVTACFADAGTVSSAQSFDCEKTHPDGSVIPAHIVSSTDVTWSAATLSDGRIQSTITAGGAEEINGYTTPMYLSWTCAP